MTDDPQPLTYATPARTDEVPWTDRVAGLFATAAIGLFLGGLGLGALSAMRGSASFGFAVGMTGLLAMLLAGAAALAAWVCAFLALRAPGKRANAVWSIVVSSLILMGYGAVFFMLVVAS